MFPLMCPSARHPPPADIYEPLLEALSFGQQSLNYPQFDPALSAACVINPRFDFRETHDAYHLDGELPGLTQKDIDIEFSDSHTLVIKGRTEREYHRTEPENVTEKAEDDNNTENDNKDVKKDSHRYRARERIFGEFRRTFSFTSQVNQDAVKASLKNGVLSIHVPKAITTVAKKVVIE
ncbi:HSP20-like chaperone [Penicillium malachiteum]|uniref:HSP20-like chaperone n=1 Tax=Penicillium malachiteum TaxID=1324776 RepID=A0AAD6HRU4_9EURO|nr:HSP20-like chaperone [Penicillium malachiteum]